jgi:hypothetical protein
VTPRAVDTFYRSVVRPWAAARAQAIGAIESEYVQIANIRPAPPPTWTVAASASVAAMWSDLADDFVAAAPRKGALPLETQRELDALLDEAARPWRDGRARPAAKSCLDLAAKMQVASDRVTSCERWLALHYPSSFHRNDDVVKPALRTNEGLLPRAFGDAQPLAR